MTESFYSLVNLLLLDSLFDSVITLIVMFSKEKLLPSHLISNNDFFVLKFYTHSKHLLYSLYEKSHSTDVLAVPIQTC